MQPWKCTLKMKSAELKRVFKWLFHFSLEMEWNGWANIEKLCAFMFMLTKAFHFFHKDFHSARRISSGWVCAKYTKRFLNLIELRCYSRKRKKRKTNFFNTTHFPTFSFTSMSLYVAIFSHPFSRTHTRLPLSISHFPFKCSAFFAGFFFFFVSFFSSNVTLSFFIGLAAFVLCVHCSFGVNSEGSCKVFYSVANN